MTPQKTLGLVILSLILISSALALVFPKETLFFYRLSQQEQIKLINNPEILVTGIGAATTEDVTRAKITVQAMPDCPENAPYQENVLQCFYVSSNFDEKNIQSTKILFKVPKIWMKTNSYNKIELRRYSYSWNINGNIVSWKSLKTNFEIEDSEYYHYVAYSDGLDYFSIIGLKEKINVPLITTAAIRNVLREQNTEIPESNGTNFFVYLPILAVICLCIFVYRPIFKETEIEKTKFEQLSRYIKNSKKSEDELRSELNKIGWEDWQINLGLIEAKK